MCIIVYQISSIARGSLAPTVPEILKEGSYHRLGKLRDREPAEVGMCQKSREVEATSIQRSEYATDREILRKGIFQKPGIGWELSYTEN
ncbi:hypothetical protein J6590_007613 [Homalodisca vitripennis]|nr:hypothetical protein J6590_007613 [Homalodisca vitripennis]